MIKVSDAIEIAINAEGGNLAVDPDHIVERPYGWVIFPNTSAFVETGDTKSALIGSGGVLVLKEDGRAIQFGSAYSTDKNLKIFEAGYLDHEDWDIVVTSVADIGKSADRILSLDVCFTKREEESGDVWKVPTDYTKERMQELLRDLPLRLRIGSIYFIIDIVEELKHQNHFDFKIEPNRGYENLP